MSDNKNLKILLAGLGITGTLAGLYYLFKGNSNKSNIKENKDLQEDFNKKLKEEEVITLPKEEKKPEVSLLDITFVTEIFKRLFNTSIEEMFIYKEVMLKDFDTSGFYKGQIESLKMINIEEFKNQIIQMIANKNYDVVVKSCNPEAYNKSLQYYLESKKYLYLNYSASLLEKIKSSFLSNNQIEYSFSQKVKSNYLKIISNIFYLNLAYSSKVVKSKLVVGELTNESERLALVRNSYMKNLDTVRSKVCEFFKVTDDSLLLSRTILRIYGYTFKEQDSTKEKYSNLNKALDLIEKNMLSGLFAEELINPDDKNYNDGVLDEVRDLQRLIDNTVDLNTIY